jgi:hypothetical protein
MATFEGLAGSASASDDELAGCSMNRTDPFFLEQRPLLLAPRETLDDFLKQLEDESIDISELHLGHGAAATLAYGTATRFYLLARKQLRSELGCDDEEIDEETVLNRGVDLCQQALKHRSTYRIEEYRATAMSVLAEEGGEMRDGGGGQEAGAPAADVSVAMQNQIKGGVRGTFAPSGVTRQGIPMFLFRPNEHFMEACSENFVADVAPGDGGDEGPWAEQAFTSALLGVMDTVYKTQVVEQSKARGTVVDRLTILIKIFLLIVSIENCICFM